MEKAMNWRIETDRYPSHEMLAGEKRYSVVDKLGNVACVTNNPDYARGFCDCLNDRT